jgi:hypothetical protein
MEQRVGLHFFQASTTRWRLQAATSHRLIVFAPEGLPPIALSLNLGMSLSTND